MEWDHFSNFLSNFYFSCFEEPLNPKYNNLPATIAEGKNTDIVWTFFTRNTSFYLVFNLLCT